MKLVVDNTMPLQNKRTGASHKIVSHLIKDRGDDEPGKLNLKQEFNSLLNVNSRVMNVDQEAVLLTNAQCEEQKEGGYNTEELDALTFGTLFENLERRYENAQKEAAPTGEQAHDIAFMYDAKLIEARALVVGKRPDDKTFTSSDRDFDNEKCGYKPARQIWGTDLPAAGITYAAPRGLKKGEKAETLEWMGQSPGSPSQAESSVHKALSPLDQHRSGAEDAFRSKTLENRSISELAVKNEKPPQPNSMSEKGAGPLEAAIGFPAPPSPAQQIVGRITQVLLGETVDIRQHANGQKTVRIILQPQSLGDVSVVIRLRESGTDLVIRPVRHETARHLEDTRDELLQKLKHTGVEFGTVDIRVADAAPGQDTRQDRPGMAQWNLSGQFQSQRDGGSSQEGGKGHQWRMPDVAALVKGGKDEVEDSNSGGLVVGRGIVV